MWKKSRFGVRHSGENLLALIMHMETQPNFEALVHTGRTAFEGRDYEEAFRQLSLAVGMLEEEGAHAWLSSPEMAELYLMRGSALAADYRDTVYEDPDIFQQVLEDYEQAVGIDPRNPLLRNLRGRLLMNCQFASYQAEAREDFVAVLEDNPEEPGALKNMGELLSKAEIYDKALYYFSKSLEQRPDKEVYMLRGVCYFKQRPPDFAAAAADFGKAQASLPQLAELYLWRATCFQELGLTQDAIKEYDRLIAVHPQRPGYYVDRGVLRLPEDPQEAMADFDQALELAPHPLAYNNRAFLHRLAGNHQAAIADAKAALGEAGEHPIAYATLAEIYADLGDREHFYQYLELALQHFYEDKIDAMMEPAFEPFVQEPRFQQLISQ
jgi:tetratricopeptide (TPR) repeat protein